jgi:hypothetical protein
VGRLGSVNSIGGTPSQFPPKIYCELEDESTPISKKSYLILCYLGSPQHPPGEIPALLGFLLPFVHRKMAPFGEDGAWPGEVQSVGGTEPNTGPAGTKKSFGRAKFGRVIFGFRGKSTHPVRENRLKKPSQP